MFIFDILQLILYHILLNNINISCINQTLNSTMIKSNPPDFGINIVNIIYALTPLISVISATYLAIYNAKLNSNNSKFQIFKDNIIQSYSTLLKTLEIGDLDTLKSFLKSTESIYLPYNLKIEILKKIQNLKKLEDDDILILNDIINYDLSNRYLK